jgi:hypothetical protein
MRSQCGLLDRPFDPSLRQAGAYASLLEPQTLAIDDRNRAAAAHLMSGATLDELKIAASDLRALSPGSVLAELVEEKIKEILSEHGVTNVGDA